MKKGFGGGESALTNDGSLHRQIKFHEIRMPVRLQRIWNVFP